MNARRLSVFAAVLMTTLAGLACSDAGEEAGFCPADALLGEGGERYGRSAAHDCRFVDDDGELLTELDGRPLCYSDENPALLAECE